MDGASFSLEVSELAGQAGGAVICSWGDTVVLATATMGGESTLHYFPLTVDYEERFYAAGRILGSRFIRREGRPSDEATLSARLVDRTIRPLFDHRLRREIQVVITTLSYDGAHDLDVVALTAASAALSISEIPWNGPVAGAGFQKKEALKPEDGSGEERLKYNALFAGTETHVNMIELEGDELGEAEAEEIFTQGVGRIKELIALQQKLIKEVGKKKLEIALPEIDARLKGEVEKFLEKKLTGTFKKGELYALKDELFDHLEKQGEDKELFGQADDVFEEVVNQYVHDLALEKETRIDGRPLDKIRDLYAEVGLFRRVHGTGLFTRGDTQIFAATTLGSPSDDQIVESIRTDEKKRFMLHYNFPSFSVGEAGRARGPGRREIGHGALAAKALTAMLPSKEEFPYVVRVVAETLSSNGSSSMATTCASCLSMMDAGVPLKKHVAGIAMGLMVDRPETTNDPNSTNTTKGQNLKYKVLTDIQGPEDHHGDMDFKVAGTTDGITAIQMDVKIDGVTREMFRDALAAAKTARLQILEVMKKTLPAPRTELSEFAPRLVTLKIDPERIGELIGPGGKVINGILDSVNNEATIDIDDDGTVYVGSNDSKRSDEVVAKIQSLMKEYAVGEVVEGDVIKTLEFGAIVDLGGGKDGMIHVSELKEGFVKTVEEVVKVGDHVKAKVVKVENGKIGLSLKALAEKKEE